MCCMSGSEIGRSVGEGKSEYIRRCAACPASLAYSVQAMRPHRPEWAEITLPPDICCAADVIRNGAVLAPSCTDTGSALLTQIIAPSPIHLVGSDKAAHAARRCMAICIQDKLSSPACVLD